VAEEEVVVARIVGRELQVERYEFRQRSVSSVSCAEGELEEQIRRLRPHLVMWSAPDERGRRLAEGLQKTDPETEWRPGCVELAGWTHLPFSELLRLMCHAGQREGGWPAEAGGPTAEEAESEDLAEIRQEEQARQAEAAEEEQPVAAEAGEADEEEQTVGVEVAEAGEEGEPVGAEAGDVSGEAAEEEEGAEQKRDELGQRLELVLAVRARRRERDPG
jgi:hypothetical protein